MRRLGAWWKRIQRLAYPAALLTLAHWLLLSRSPVEALLHAAPVIALWGTAAARRLSRSASKAI
jgi:sulfoxide reductase heme-binding subunit YedZ